jgi:uncharacterized protein YndB with AHSA1/START domain
MLVKALKVLLLLLVVVAVVLGAGGLLLSPKFTVTRTVTINAPADKVYPLIANPRAWRQWSVWLKRDPSMAVTYSGPESGTGATWEWKSQSEGDGRMRFTAAEPPQRVAYELYFPDFGTTSTGELRLRPVTETPGNRVEVTWTMNGDMGKNPLYRWIGLMADGMVGKDFAAGLANLKAIAEQP